MSLLNSLFRNTKGFIELRVPRKGNVRNEVLYAKPSDHEKIGSFIKKHKKDENIYFGVASRDGKGGKKENIVDIPAVWVDIDFKETPQNIIDPLIEDLNETLPPTAIINTGNGYHIYWVLKKSLDKSQIPVHEQINTNLAGHLCGDYSGIDSSRILRVPNTINQKYESKPTVEVVKNTGYTYSLEDFDCLTHFEKPTTNKTVNTGNNKDSERIQRIMSCSFMQYCEENAEELSEPEWYSMVTQLCQETGGRSKIHELSKPYKGYSSQETDTKILHATDSSPGPHTCEYIKTNIKDCGQRCDVTAPKHLAFKKADIVDDPAEDADNDESPSAGDADNADTNADIPADKNSGNADIPADTSNNRANRSMKDDIEDFISANSGIFSTAYLDNEINVKTKQERDYRTKVLSRLVKKGKVEKLPGRVGWYEIPTMELRKQNPADFCPEGLDLPWPLGIGDVATVDPGSLIVLAGVHNAGKTSLALNLLFNIIVQSGIGRKKEKEKNKKESTSTQLADSMGVDQLRLTYINTEMHDIELARKFKAYEEPSGHNRIRQGIENGEVVFYTPVNSLSGGKYATTIDPDGINIIDFLEVYGDFYKIGQIMTDIHSRLNNGIAIVLTQKSQDKAVGRGGDFSAEKPRLYVTLDNNYPYCKTVTIRKAKIPTDPEHDPNGLSKDFVIRKGVEFQELTGWEHIHQNRRKELNAGYDAETKAAQEETSIPA